MWTVNFGGNSVTKVLALISGGMSIGPTNGFGGTYALLQAGGCGAAKKSIYRRLFVSCRVYRNSNGIL